MLSLRFILDAFLWQQVKPGTLILAAITAVIIILSIIFTAIELRKAKNITDDGRDEYAVGPSPADGDMPSADDTD
jgi:hypothetical protein